MHLRPALPYFGGKQRYAPLIASLLPAHEVYVEPFAGSAAVLIAKERVRHEVLNDLDAEIVNFHRCLRDRPAELELACALTPYARDEYEAATFEPGLDDIERARRWWVRTTQGFSRSGNHSTGWSISTSQNTGRPRYTLNRLGRFAAVAERLAGTFIENQDALAVIARWASNPKACLYLDPPYPDESRDATGEYRMEAGAPEFHAAMAGSVSDAKAAVVISGYDCELYDELFATWHRMALPTPRRPSGRPSPSEVLWSNRPLAPIPVAR